MTLQESNAYASSNGNGETEPAGAPLTTPESKKEQAAEGFKFGAGDLLNLTSVPTYNSVEEERQGLKERLVAAIRIFAREGLDHHIAGHLTVRDPGNPHHFWVNPFGLAFSLMTVSDLILVDQKGDVIGGGKEGRRIVNLAGFTIHSSIHKARPEVQAICHSHSVYGKAFSTLGIPLEITTQDSCVFHNDIALLNNFGGVVIDGTEGCAIADALEKKKAIILQNHGILTVGSSIESAVAWFILLEKQCQVQLLADAASARYGKPPVLIDEAQATFTYKEIGTERAGYFTASPYFQVIEHEQGKAYKV